jgi:uncharacterized protein with PIN domain
VRFYCDAMLGGLARWLRALGYEADWEHGIDDAELVERAGQKQAVLLSSDRPLFNRKRVTSGEVRALFVPRHAPVLDQAVFVLNTFSLSVAPLRCMACGGALATVPRADIEAEVPPGAFKCFETFFRCERCRKVYWHGTHWTKIEATRTAIADRLTRPR